MESIGIHRAAQGDGITYNDLPTEIQVSLTFKDLYESMSITKFTDFKMLVNNIGLIDYVAALSGVCLNKPDYLRSLDILISGKVDTLRDLPGNIKGKFMDALRDGLMNSFLH